MQIFIEFPNIFSRKAFFMKIETDKGVIASMYVDMWNEKEYKKIEEAIEKHRASRGKLLHYAGLN